MLIGNLRIHTSEALPFAREKLRSALVRAGISRVAAAQFVGHLSERLRKRLPQEISLSLDPSTGELILQPGEFANDLQRFALDSPDLDVLQQMREVLSRLSREELLYDLERQVQERTLELNVEREKSDRLLQSMLPISIAHRLKNGETIADRHVASVVFVDIVGFTKWAAQLNALHLIEYLDIIFGEFDHISRRFGLEKIKTIGDCYMAAAGLPEEQSDHADRAVLAGLCIIDSMATVRERLQADLQVRIGIHSGSLVAGVIGEVKPFYDIWGDSVNIASRMESHGAAGRLHISDDVRQALTQNYLLEERGVIEIKNRGRMTTWYVNGRC